MTQEEKQLLLIDLCARLPHGVIMCTPGGRTYSLNPIALNSLVISLNGLAEDKPYLRPMSNMTDEEKKELENYLAAEAISSINGVFELMRAQRHTSNFLYSKHLDVLGLIEKGLALTALEGMYER